MTVTSNTHYVGVGSRNEDIFVTATTDVVVLAGAGDDYINAWIGSDYLVGGQGRDFIFDSLGNNTIFGDDDAYSSAGSADTIVAANGIDNIFSGGGDDFVNGQAGSDNIDGGYGNDTLWGGLGSDSIFGSFGNDVLYGGAGSAPPFSSIITNYEGTADTLTAPRTHNPTPGAIVADPDADFLDGGDGDDAVYGQAGNDTLIGGDGNDYLDGGTEADLMRGGGGNDTYVVDNALDLVVESAGAGFDTVLTSVVNFTLSADAEIEALVANGVGSFVLVGNEFDNAISGSSGNDVLFGNGGKDQLAGGDGNDQLSGGLGNDALTGGAGKDTFVFNSKLNKATNLDTIADFNVKDDSIWLDNAMFKKLGKGTESNPGKLKKAFFTIGSKAKDKNDYLVYDNKKGVLLYDADGSGSGKAIEITKVAKNLKMGAPDFFVI